ncbi:MAG: hypothetical protein JWM68_5088 [Verrucomicrobiales bacterium]|nr:hypothetical protein [Verrucomicrobiales bacterium]
MKTETRTLFKKSALLLGAVTAATTTAHASADYGPAIWRPTCSTHFYTGYTARQVYVIHDMEGYYASTISYLQGCNNSVSVHYAVNGKQDAASDMPAGEITQMVLDSNSAWTSGCWNRYAEQTEHEGFASNPAWYTEAMFQSSSALTKSKANKYGIVKDRNHIIAHGQKLVSGWSAWASANLSFDPNCNSHTDPGPYWDWSYYMSLVNGGNASAWYFGAGQDGWTSMNSLTPQIWTDAGWPGIIYSDQVGADSEVLGPLTSFTGTADASVNVSVYPQSGSSAAHDMQVFWKTGAENFLDAPKSSPIVTYNLQNNWTRLNLNVSSAKWSGQNVNQLRLDFDQANTGTRWIVNHIITQQTPKYWFGSSASGWTLGNGLSGLAWTGTGWPGCIYADQVGNDGFFYSPGALNYLGGANDQIVVAIYPQNGSTANHDMKVYWTTASDGTWTESKSSSTVAYTAQNGWATVVLPVGANANWSSDYITKLRLDVDAVNSGVRWIIDYVAISHTTASKL